MNKTYGLLAEFSTHEELIHAAEEAYAAGFRNMDGYAPFAVEGLAECFNLAGRNGISPSVLLNILTGTLFSAPRHVQLTADAAFAVRSASSIGLRWTSA